ncbi:FAD-dependent oxidoreductase [Calothrix sp. UHCC 0171]|uniref:FAD-dependent oxidoreductase n=1 Tax=Calothrix sp. UHCC 0171 TaxID=3110245 RepID=UPI002B1EF692|nr:FAD-dependent oxidoreductase [Calothrix sp. UHCC 0171]MEA5572370.1 FAD-dependent oxidoreductase [Calothrix sp. UHCC 0171]
MSNIQSANNSTVRNYDIIAFGDEVPGILALVCAAREHFRRTNKYPRSLLLFKGKSQLGIGGHLVRGGLSYLDRSVVPVDIRKQYGLDIYGDESAIYKEFLKRTGVVQVGLDPKKGDFVLREMLQEVRADILSNADIQSVLKQGQKITGIRLTNNETYMAKIFIDSTINAELAQFAGVKKLRGFETFGLPDSELSVTLTFETEGLSVQALKDIEMNYMQRLANLNDTEAQNWIKIAAGGDSDRISQLSEPFITNKNDLSKIAMYAGSDFIDVRSFALSIAYHAFRGTALSLDQSGAVLDKGNVAVFPNHRMSWNALLFDVNAEQAETLSREDAKPTAAMLKEMQLMSQWFQSLGAKSVKPAPELYIRHAGNIIGVNDPLTGAEMLKGGVPVSEALGTFGYHFDIRGGIEGLGTRASEKGLGNILFFKLPAPLFNVGMQHALLKNVPNLAVISPASGFEGYAASAGRIVEFNCAVGQAVGIAAITAMLSSRNLNQISNQEIRDILASTGKLSKIYGQANPKQEEIARLDKFENALAA